MFNVLRNKLLYVFVSSVLIMGGCAKTTTTTTNTDNGPGSTVQVFYSEPADRAYTELGLVTTQTGQTIFHDRSAEGMINKLKIEAEKMGADAISFVLQMKVHGVLRVVAIPALTVETLRV